MSSPALYLVQFLPELARKDRRLHTRSTRAITLTDVSSTNDCAERVEVGREYGRANVSLLFGRLGAPSYHIRLHLGATHQLTSVGPAH